MLVAKIPHIDLFFQPGNPMKWRSTFWEGDSLFKRECRAISPDGQSPRKLVECWVRVIANLQEPITLHTGVHNVVERSMIVATLDTGEPDTVVSHLRCLWIPGK
jgi:hypothetical protein